MGVNLHQLSDFELGHHLGFHTSTSDRGISGFACKNELLWKLLGNADIASAGLKDTLW